MNSPNATHAHFRAWFESRYSELAETAGRLASSHQLPAREGKTEILSELYAALARAWPGKLDTEGEDGRLAFAFATMRNLARRKRDAGSRHSRRFTSLDEATVDRTHEPTQPDEAVIEAMFDSEVRQRLRAAIADDLSPDEREVIILMYVFGQNQADTAGELKLPARTVSRIHESATRKLRAALRSAPLDAAESKRSGVR